ncbi:MAG: hypothetical protein IT340_21150 [Chloroflexi bacterium]|nr:hypothetical protein [Chloroflexota bacterium]
MSEPIMSREHEALSVSVRERLTQRFGGDRAAALYGYWQLLATTTGTSRLRSTLGAEGYRAALAALAQAGIDLPRQGGAGPAAGLDTQPGPGAPATQTVQRQLLRQAGLTGLFGWGRVAGRLDVSFGRAGAVGYPQDTLVTGLELSHLAPLTYHIGEIRAQPSLTTANPPVLLRVGGYSDAAGRLQVLASAVATADDAVVTGLFGGQPGTLEVIVYRCYDGAGADDTSYAIARGVLA